MARWVDGRVYVEDSVAIANAVSGKELLDRYMRDIEVLTLGLTRMRGTSMRVGPVELLRFGRPKVSKYQVHWPIESGLAVGAPGGAFKVRATGGRLVATLEGYRPRVPPFVYTLVQLPIHHLLTRLYLLRARGRMPAPGVRATPRDRFRAASVDVALCLTLAGLAGRRGPRPTLAIAAAYHVACWSIWGRTLGGLVVRQRVVGIDGSRMTAAQSLLRLGLLPAYWVTGRAVHDELACTEVVTDRAT